MKEDYLFTDIVYYHTIIEKQQKHNIQKNFVLSIKAAMAMATIKTKQTA